jgi:hypothetical protein
MLTCITGDKYHNRKENVLLTKFNKKDKIIYYSFFMLKKKDTKIKNKLS